MNKEFASDIIAGMTAKLKYIPSKYFYDEKGSEIFREIMNMPEYYLTDAEFEIFTNHKDDILKIFQKKSQKFNLIEFGAGDGYKTKILANYFLDNGVDFTYIPIDISSDVLLYLTEDFKSVMPDIIIEGINDDYFKALHNLRERNSNTQNIVMFLGSNIGNFAHTESIIFLKSLRNELNTGDMLFIGFDLKKDPRIILDAYNDKAGITRNFNLNLLHRLNKEFDGDFDIQSFLHYPIYEPANGEAKSFLISLIEQSVFLKKLNLEINFKLSEPIFTEVSQKYDFETIDRFANSSGFKPISIYTDSKHYFADVIWEAV